MPQENPEDSVRHPNLSTSLFLLAAAAAITATTSSARAQWVSYVNETGTRLSAAASLVSADQQEKDYAWADLDQDGDIDLVIGRKQPFTTSGRFPNVLLMNEGGVLTDRSATLTTSTVPGSTAFLDATNDRDVEIADVTGDGWLDVITCTTLSAGQAQYIRVPRVYINLGNDVNGNWQGLLYDDPLRIDDTNWGNGEHRFCGVSSGDIDGDGDLDLYFGDYQQGGPRSVDVNDRLLINDGTGYFTDESAQRMTATMLESSFGMHVKIVDMNNDGKLDIVKDDALNAPQGISISVNDTATEGVFGTYQIAYGNTPYHFNIGDLNNDNLPDMIVSDDGQDRYILNQTTTPGQAPVPFSATIPFSYSGGGSDDGFAGNNLIIDLDNDGWNDAVVADVDVDISGYNRRCHIFRNLGNAPNVTLQEQIVGGQVVGGITPADLQGTFDVAVFDINGDGFNDMVVGRRAGTQIYINSPPSGLTFTYVGGLPTNIDPTIPRDVVVDINTVGAVQPVSGTGALFYSVNGASYQSTPMTDSNGVYSAALPAMNCTDSVRFYVEVQGDNSVTYSDPPTAPTGVYEALVAFGTDTIYEEDFEVGSTGWTVANGAGLTTGSWERADPIGTTWQSNIAAPFGDAQAGAADFCFITQQGAPGASAGSSDVDNGFTELTSPALDYSGTDGTISFQAWHYSSVNGSDTLDVEVTGDGSTWVPVMAISPDTSNAPNNTNQWTQYSFRVGEFITPTATVQVRFRSKDLGNGQIVESGIDVFRAELFNCDYCQPTFTLQTVGPAELSMCGELLFPGASTTLKVESMPAFASGLLLFDALPAPSPWNGGELITPAPVVLGQIFGNANGDFQAPLAIGGLLPAGWALYVQAVYVDAAQTAGVGVTNALRVEWL